MINASGNADYSIKQTGLDWGVDDTPSSSRPSLAKIFSFIKSISRDSVEVTTIGPAEHSLLRARGKLSHPSVNGHLILNPNGIDLRIIAGKIDHVVFETLNEGSYKATFKNADNQSVLSINFTADEKPGTEKITVCSRQGKLKAFDAGQNIEALWRNMTDVHHFYPMLKQFNISKLEAFHAVPDDLAVQVAPQSVMTVLKNMEKEQTPLMVFIGNDAVIQVYTGPVRKIIPLPTADKIAVHGITREGEKAVFKLALNQNDQAWVVNKISTQGYITSLEIFDKDNNHIAQFYGNRTEGEKQNKQWAELMQSLPRLADTGSAI